MQNVGTFHIKWQLEVFTLQFLYRLNKQDVMCSLLSFRGAGRQILLPLDRVSQAVFYGL